MYLSIRITKRGCKTPITKSINPCERLSVLLNSTQSSLMYQGLATQLGGEVSHALGSVLAEAREFGQDLQSAVTGLGATTSEVFDQVR